MVLPKIILLKEGFQLLAESTIVRLRIRLASPWYVQIVQFYIWLVALRVFLFFPSMIHSGQYALEFIANDFAASFLCVL